ncbi:MAG: glycosyltransferase family 2 protein [Candidatus Ozemobacteraceae bacterium]
MFANPSVLWVVLPVYNEAPRLPQLLHRWKNTSALLSRPVVFVLVDDGSTDGSAEILQAFTRYQPSVHLVIHRPNQGLGATIRDGLNRVMENCRPEDLVTTMDSDGTHPPELLPTMIERQKRTKADVVIASRFRMGSRVEGLSMNRRILSIGAATLLKILAPVPGVRDYTCGFRLLRASALLQTQNMCPKGVVSAKGFESTLELLLNLVRSGATFTEVAFHLDYAAKAGSSHMQIGRTIKGVLTTAAQFRFRI